MIATGVTTTVRDFVRMAFNEVGVKLQFIGQGPKEIAKVLECSNQDYQVPKGQIVLAVDPQYYRPTEVDLLIGDATKAKKTTGLGP